MGGGKWYFIDMRSLRLVAINFDWFVEVQSSQVLSKFNKNGH
jgi:hypothetical protein